MVRDQVRRTRTATVLVTHDVLDAVTLADRVVVLHDGQVVEQGRPLDVLTDPVHPFTAALAGVNLVVGGSWPSPTAARRWRARTVSWSRAAPASRAGGRR